MSGHVRSWSGHVESRHPDLESQTAPLFAGGKPKDTLWAMTEAAPDGPQNAESDTVRKPKCYPTPCQKRARNAGLFGAQKCQNPKYGRIEIGTPVFSDAYIGTVRHLYIGTRIYGHHRDAYLGAPVLPRASTSADSPASAFRPFEFRHSRVDIRRTFSPFGFALF